MSYATNNTSVSSSTVNFPCAGSVKTGILVANAPVLITPTFRDIAGNQTTGAQVYYPPGFYSWRKPVDNFAFIQAVSGQIALVTAEALLLREANQ